ncbi:putative glutamine synthetase [Xylariaceae sp. FL0662B]|nr:putative glutamine synthetase [Xylariaceae sp. FL0662B]
MLEVNMAPIERVTLQTLPDVLQYDTKVKLAGVDVDGQLRGKLVSKKKFLSIAKEGFGFCSVIFGWDMLDRTYDKELKISNKQNGYRDLIAVPDLNSFRRIPWEGDIPFFLVSFFDDSKPLCACPRGLLKTTVDRLKSKGYNAMAGAELEFFQFKVPGTTPSNSDSSSPSIASFLDTHPPHALPTLTDGMFGYSITRPTLNKSYYHGVYDACAAFRCDLEGWHTESGPGVYEAALEFGQISEMADRVSLFKYVVRSVAAGHGITPCFMAKPRQGLPGSSGHTHVSVVDATSGTNLFFRETPDANAPWPDVVHLSDLGRHFLAGILDGLPDVMPMVAPTVNSYKRLVENFWAPVTVSWGLEHRAASVRLIAPPTSKPGATRFEVRVPGADANPYFVMAAVLALGWRGVERKLDIPIPPLGKDQDVGGAGDQGVRLARSLREATERFMRKDSIAREVFGDDFVDHFGGTRENELRLWDEAVTDWELKRYVETA